MKLLKLVCFCQQITKLYQLVQFEGWKLELLMDLKIGINNKPECKSFVTLFLRYSDPENVTFFFNFPFYN